MMLRVFGIAVLSAALALAGRRTPRPRSRRPRTATSKARSATAAARRCPGVTVTVTNIDTGDRRAIVVTNESGVYRAPLLPLGRYKVSAELQGFKKFEQQGITLSAGQTALINVELSVGNVTETITVTERVAGRAAGQDRPRPHDRRERRSATCRSSRAIPTTSRSSRRTSPATRTTSSACRASPPTARRCTPTTRSTATPTPRRIAPACACCRCRRCWCAK